jgi:hypothetical protein
MTARRLTLSFLILALAAVPMAAVDPALMKLVPPDATVVAGVNVEQARITPFGQFVLKQMPLDDEGFRNMMESTGFDPRRDLREILVASKGGQPSKHSQGIVMATGSFDAPRIVAAAKVLGVTVTDYAGVEVLSSKESPAGGFAFLDRSLAIAGETEQVKAAIDRYKKGGAGPGATLAAKAAEWSGRTDAWFITAGSPAEWAHRMPDSQAAGPMKSVSLDAIEQSSGGIKFGSVVKISVEAVARTDKDAAALGDVVRFVAGMIQLNRDKQGPDQMAALLDSMELKTDSRTVTLGFSVPQEQLEKMIQSGHGPAKKPAPRSKATTI